MGHLINEGYADSEEDAAVIMVNMSEEWKQSILEAKGEGPEAAEPGSRLFQQIFRGAKKLGGQSKQDKILLLVQVKALKQIEE